MVAKISGWRLFIIAAVMALCPYAARAADDFTTDDPGAGDCISGGYTTCGQNLKLTILPLWNGNGTNMALYVQMDTGVWTMVACYPRDTQVSKVVTLYVSWLTRQHKYLFKMNAQNDCDPHVYLTGNEHAHTHTWTEFVTGPASDSPYAGWVYLAQPNGMGGYTYWWLKSWTGCGNNINGPLYNTCWDTNSNLALKMTSKGAQMVATTGNLAAAGQNGGQAQTFGVTGDAGSGSYWVWNYFSGVYHWVVPAYDRDAAPGTPNAGRWAAMTMGGAYSQYYAIGLGSALALQRIATDGVNTAGLPGLAFGYVLQ